MRWVHFSRASVATLAGAVTAVVAAVTTAAQQTTPTSSAAPSNFTIFIRGVAVGSEQIGLERTAQGWTITSTGRIGPPLEIVIRSLEVRYDAAWKPLQLTIDATTRGQVTTLKTVVSGTSARSEMSTGGTATDKTDTIDEAAILLPNLFFGPYEALAARLHVARAGEMLPAYITPLGSMTISVGTASEEQIQTVDRVIKARRTPITMTMPTAPATSAEIWGDESGRLLRVSVPAQSLEVLREDIASVASRRVTVSRPNDEQVRVTANGFSIAATLSKPTAADGRPAPAVVLVSGAEPTDRDETVAGIPVFGQLAGALADAGFFVLRYDKRGVGQSGGRPESATLADYAEDLRAAIRFLANRKDIDRRRIAVIGYGDGGPVAMIAASKEDRIAAVALVASVGMKGADASLAQVQRALDRWKRTEAEKQSALALQKQIQNAVLSGTGWDGIAPEVRRQADTPWFHSFLTFDPARMMRDIDQPLLILHGALDAQVTPANADNLEQVAKTRRRGSVEVVRVPGVNHLLVAAATGDVDEYASLASRTVSTDVTAPLIGWLQKVLAPPTSR
jgi:pimeloyl-ACP methyl ester carboxylesterase